MKIYDFIGAKGYEILHPVDDDGYERFDLISRSPTQAPSIPIRVRRVRPSKREGFKPSDAPYACLSSILVFRRSAVDALRDILDAHGELLPLDDEEGAELYVYNPRAIEALDHAKSGGWRDEQGRLDLVNRHVFFPSVVEGVDIFRQTENRGGNIYFSERFLQRWKKAKLKGIDFKLAWDSDLPPDQQPNVRTSKPVKMSTIRG